MLDAEQAHYIGRVLRCRVGDPLIVFDAHGTERRATIESLAKNRTMLILGERLAPVPESRARIVLLQALVKSDAMDLIVQKATELGVEAVFAVHTEFSVVKLDTERSRNRLSHWTRIAASACEQSGRHRPPALAVFPALEIAIDALPEATARIAFDVGARASLDSALPAGSSPVAVAIGPEGGFSPTECHTLEASGFKICALGPRILRADTAAIAACAAVQLKVGDLGEACA